MIIIFLALTVNGLHCHKMMLMRMIMVNSFSSCVYIGVYMCELQYKSNFSFIFLLRVVKYQMYVHLYFTKQIPTWHTVYKMIRNTTTRNTKYIFRSIFNSFVSVVCSVVCPLLPFSA